MPAHRHVERISEGDLPSAHGFDRSLAVDASGADNWEAKPFMPFYRDAPWFEDGKRAEMPTADYSSDLIVDRIIGYMDGDANTGAPFIAYVAFQAVHIPVQARRDITARYAGQFDDGGATLREARWQRAKDLGLIPHDAALAALPETMRTWHALSADDKTTYAKAMAVYSAMLGAMDNAIGRLIDHVKAKGEFDNTIFIVTSDNGPEPSDPVHAPGMNLWMALHGDDWNVETLGEKGSLAFIGPEWAASVSSPSRLFKFYTTEGGCRRGRPCLLGMGHARRARHRSRPHASRPHGGVDRVGVPRGGRHGRRTIRRPDWPADTRSRPITPEHRIMKRLMYPLALVLIAAGVPAFARQSGGVRVEFQGPGGHSFGAYGRVSALHAAARAVLLIQQELPAGSFQITNLTGGNSVNAIASDGLIELTLTAGSADAYEALVTAVTKAAADGAAAENRFRGVTAGDLTSGAPATVRSRVTRF